MPVIKCPIDGCDYSTPDLEAVIGAALLNAHTTTHQARGPPQAARVERVKRPDISSAGTTEDWIYFQSRWGDYTKATKLVGPDRVLQLLECCDEQLRRDLTRNAGGTLAGETEEDVLAAIKALAVREENVMVARVALHHMKQDRDEPIRAFAARLKGQASVCKYVKTCPGCDRQVTYTEAILTDVLCRGIADAEIQRDLLGDTNQAMTLEQAIKFVEAKESGKRSANRLSTTQSAEAAGSSYRRQKKPQTPTSAQANPEVCSYCGMKGHGRNSPTRIRRVDCPAYGSACDSCGREHHFSKMCRSKGDNRPTKGHQENAIADLVCQVTSSQHSDIVDHHTYNRSTQSWCKKQSRPQPYIAITVQTNQDDYTRLGQRLKATPRHFTTQAMAEVAWPAPPR